jgi:hypothetical protein
VRDVVVVPGAELTFTGDLTTSSSNGPHDFRVRATAVMRVEAKRPLRISDLTMKHAQPLRALMALAADRPFGATTRPGSLVRQLCEAM